MFTEILRIKPLLDRASQAAMEQTLTKRFARVAQTFGSGLKNVIKGSVIGISLGLLAKILNPLQELEDKIKDLLGQGTDLREMASRFGTDTGTFQRLQALGVTAGLKPEDLRDMLTKFTQAVEEARLGSLNPEEPLSPRARAVAQFANRQDLAAAFFDFIQDLNKFGKSTAPEMLKFLNDNAALLDSAEKNRVAGKPLSDEERKALVQLQRLENQGGGRARQQVETDVFGNPLFGAQKRFVDQDQAEAQKKLSKLPTTQQVAQAANKYADLDTSKNILDVVNQTQDFVNASRNVNQNIIAMMAAADKRDEAFKTKQLAQFDALLKGAQAVTDLKEGLQNLLSGVTQLVGKLTVITNFIPRLTSTRWWNAIGGSKE